MEAKGNEMHLKTNQDGYKLKLRTDYVLLLGCCMKIHWFELFIHKWWCQSFFE